MSNGHSWSSIKKYTLSEIGTFYKTIVIMEREKRIENLIHNWMSTHYEHKHLMETIREIDGKSKVLQQKEDKRSTLEIKAEWERLANFMRRKK